MALVIDDTLISNVADNLRAAMTTDPKMRKVIQQHIREALWDARKEMINSVNIANGDHRQSLRAIRNSVYDKILGGQINIKKAKSEHGSGNSYTPPRKLTPGQRGGNRRPRSERTEQINRGSPLDRGWILRMVNAGTRPRYANGRNGKWGKSGGNRTFFKLQEQGDYYRGSIGARNFFGTIGRRELETALSNLSKMINEEFKKLFKN